MIFCPTCKSEPNAVLKGRIAGLAMCRKKNLAGEGERNVTNTRAVEVMGFKNLGL